MSATSDDLLTAMWNAIERAGDVEREMRSTVDELAAWREVARAAIAALDREIARRREEDAARTIAYAEVRTNVEPHSETYMHFVAGHGDE